MQLICVIEKDVEDADKAKDAYDEIVEKLADMPDLRINGNYTNHFEPEVTPP